MTNTPDFDTLYQTLADALRTNREAHIQRDTTLAQTTRRHETVMAQAGQQFDETAQQATHSYEAAIKQVEQEVNARRTETDSIKGAVERLTFQAPRTTANVGFPLKELPIAPLRTDGVTPCKGLAEAHATALAASSELKNATDDWQRARRSRDQRIWWLAVMVGVIMAAAAGLFYKNYQQQQRIADSTATAVAFANAEATQHANSTATAVAFEQLRDNLPIIQTFSGIEMVFVPAGCFMMGSNDGDQRERPVHRVCFTESYWIGRTEITNTQYRACVNAGACTPPGNQRFYEDPNYENHPVTYVSWNQATAYAEWIGARLPTEAEWEYGARGPEGRMYPWGDGLPTCEQANTHGCRGNTWAVGSRPDNASWVGALDMSGNVGEWVEDWYGPYSSEEQINPAGAVSGEARVLRGGTWLTSSGVASSTDRSWREPTLQSYSYGFRIVLTASSSEG